MNVKPLSDRVLVLPNPAEEKTAGGLIIPDTAKEKPLAGKVVAVGPGTSEVKMEVKVGDQVHPGQSVRNHLCRLLLPNKVSPCCPQYCAVNQLYKSVFQL